MRITFTTDRELDDGEIRCVVTYLKRASYFVGIGDSATIEVEGHPEFDHHTPTEHPDLASAWGRGLTERER